MSEGETIFGAVCTVVIICFVIFAVFVFGIKAGVYHVQKEAVERGYMEYNLKTGELDWVKPVGVEL